MIPRNPTTLDHAHFDLAIIGAGVYGIATALEAARRGLRPVLLERHDFGHATSFNSLRILHGGLRYLQSLDLPRFHESVRERHWFCRYFPELIQPLPCLMPLYNRGLKRPLPLRLALAINDHLARHRNHHLPPHLHLPPSLLLTANETTRWFPLTPTENLQGGALWYDAVMTNSQRILIEMLHWACAYGATAHNYVNVDHFLTAGNHPHGQLLGLAATDTCTGQPLTIHTRAAINCTGPALSTLLQSGNQRPINSPSEPLFTPSLAFNLLLDRPAMSRAAVAIQAPAADAPIRFILPWRSRLLAGTVHAPWHADATDSPTPTAAQIAAFLDELNAAVPRLHLTPADVRRVYAGLLPATRPGTAELTTRPRIHDHAHHRDGPAGLVSVAGIKFTTARHVAECALRRAFARTRPLPEYQPGTDRPVTHPRLDLTCPDQLFREDDAFTRDELARIVRQEAVTTLDDLLMRRTDWACNPTHEHDLTQRVTDLLANAHCPLPR